MLSDKDDMKIVWGENGFHEYRNYLNDVCGIANNEGNILLMITFCDRVAFQPKVDVALLSST